jgi:hypothetical protein
MCDNPFFDMRDPDGYLTEVGQASQPTIDAFKKFAGWLLFAATTKARSGQFSVHTAEPFLDSALGENLS